VDNRLRKLERQAATGDIDAQKKLAVERDRANTSYTVYVLKEAEWQYNDNWYSTYEPEVVHAYRTRERAEKEIVKRFRDFLLKPPCIEGRDWVDLHGVHSLQYFIGNSYDAGLESTAVEDLRAMGFKIKQVKDVLLADDNYTHYTTYRARDQEHFIISCIPPEKVDLALAKKILDYINEHLYEIVETTLE